VSLQPWFATNIPAHISLRHRPDRSAAGCGRARLGQASGATSCRTGHDGRPLRAVLLPVRHKPMSPGPTTWLTRRLAGCCEPRWAMRCWREMSSEAGQIDRGIPAPPPKVASRLYDSPHRPFSRGLFRETPPRCLDRGLPCCAGLAGLSTTVPRYNGIGLKSLLRLAPGTRTPGCPAETEAPGRQPPFPPDGWPALLPL
jgi:hypothetical protein